MVQSYNSPEARDAAIDGLERLQDIVGYHFPWCDDYLKSVKVPCACEVQPFDPSTRLRTQRLALIGNYYPHFPPRPPTPPMAGQPPASDVLDVPLAQFKAAQAVNATHLSSDGLTAYDEREYSIWQCFWDEETKAFGGWWHKEDYDLPADAIRM